MDALIGLIRKYGMEFKDQLVFDRIREELRIFCANHTIDQVYNTKFLDIVQAVKERLQMSITRLGNNGIKILNLVVPKPTIPSDIAANYKQVSSINLIAVLALDLIQVRIVTTAAAVFYFPPRLATQCSCIM